MRVNTFFHKLVFGVVYKVLSSVASGETEGKNCTRYNLIGDGNSCLADIVSIDTFNFGHIPVFNTQSLCINRIHPNGSVAQIASGLRKHIQAGTGDAVLSGSQDELIAVLLRCGERWRRNVTGNRSNGLFVGFVLEALEGIDFNLAARCSKRFVIRVLVVFLCLDR